MTKWLSITLAVAAVLIFLLLGAYLYFRDATPDNGPAAGTSTNPFGFLTGDNVQTANTLSVILDDGSSIGVPDFTKTGQPEWAGPDAGYQVAGDAITGDFLITYIPSDTQGSQQQFLIALMAEPLGATRIASEEALRAKLLLSDRELCALDVSVAVGPGVNESYRGQDLGLSFCPGSVTLP